MTHLDNRRRAAVFAAFAAAAALIVLVALSALSLGDVGDHTSIAGRVNEGLAALAFLFGATSLALLTPPGAWGWWLAGVVGLAASGLTMLFVVVTTFEPPIWLFWAEVAVSFVGLALIAASAIRRRTLPWWGAVGLVLLLPIMFLVPFNGIPMAAVWALLGVAAAREGRRQRAGSADEALAMLPS